MRDKRMSDKRKYKHKPYVDLSGEAFGNITAVALERVEMVEGKRKEWYRCLCALCGGEKLFERQELLKNPNRQTCGCRSIPMKAGDVKNSIEAIMQAEGSEYWYCRCSVCGELIALQPKQFRMTFDYEGCAFCRAEQRLRAHNKRRAEERKKPKAQAPVPQLKYSSTADMDIKEMKKKAHKAGMSYGKYGASLRPVTVRKAPRGYTSWYERNGMK